MSWQVYCHEVHKDCSNTILILFWSEQNDNFYVTSLISSDKSLLKWVWSSSLIHQSWREPVVPPFPLGQSGQKRQIEPSRQMRNILIAWSKTVITTTLLMQWISQSLTLSHPYNVQLPIRSKISMTQIVDCQFPYNRFIMINEITSSHHSNGITIM